jgi:fibronectin type 3 domain-containing protein
MLRRSVAVVASLLAAAVLCAVVWAEEPATPAKDSATTPSDGLSDGRASSELTIDWANLQFPTQVSHVESVVDSTIKIYGQVYIAGATDVQDRPVDGVTAQVGFGPPETLPSSDQWYWFDMRPDPGFDFTQNNDEYVGKLLVPVAGTFKYTTRWSTDGGETWTYTDQVGPPYDEPDAGDLTVAIADDTTPPGVPTDLSASPVTATEVELSWTAPPDIDGDIAGYRLYRKNASASSFTEVTSLVDPINRVGTTSYTDTTVSNDATYSYYVTAIDVANNESSASNTADATTPLPVDLVALDAETTGDAVRLSWATAGETNNAAFRVQRRVPAAQNGSAGAWTTVGSVDGAGTTTRRQQYRFTDDALPFAAGRLAYRLQQVDVDGTTSLSDPVTVERPVRQVELRRPAPNPARSRLRVQVAVPAAAQAETATLQLYDVMGRRLRTVPVAPGRHEVQIDVASLASGTYLLRLTAGPTTRTQKITVLQ